MNEVLIYALKVIAIHGLLYFFYRLVLKNSARHALNRAYLLGALLLAFFIPFMDLSLVNPTQVIAKENPVIFWLSEPVAGLDEFELVPVKGYQAFSYWSLLPAAYALIATTLIIRSIVYLVLLGRLKKHSEHIQKRWFSLFKTSHNRPFSFFSNVFIPRWLFGTNAFRQVLAHECVHVRQLHSVDRLLLDFVVSLFWFNPFIYLYRNALIEIHEFQADEAVVKRFNDPIGYQEILFSQLQSPEYSGLVSHFNFSMIKKRIVMMNKQSKKSGWVYSLTVPVTLMIVFAFSNKQAMEPLNEVGEELTTLIGPITRVNDAALELFQEANEPSIMPIKEASLTRMTSGFGKRMHPITKKEQWHLGVDFSCKVGSEVMATANGKVEAVTDNPKGYGKLITIDHGNEYKTRYAQLSEFKVKEGDQVEKGQVIALSGNSGMSTAPHLHYEVQKGDKRVDPVDYIKDYDFTPKLKEIKTPKTEKSQKEEALLRKEEALAAKELELAKKEELLAKKALEQVDKMNQQELKRAGMELQRAEGERERVEMELRMKEAEKTFEKSTTAFIYNGEVFYDVEDLKLSGKTTSYQNKKAEEVDFKLAAGIKNVIIINDLPEEEIEKRRQAEDEFWSKIWGDDKSIYLTIQKTHPNKSPLYVIDGEIVEDVSEIQPEDIARVNVLKNEKAISQYGAEAKNGVIEITTKNKQKDKQKSKTKSKKENQSQEGGKSERLTKISEFLKDYEGDGYDPHNWNIVIREDRVKLKRVNSLEVIVLHDQFFEVK